MENKNKTKNENENKNKTRRVNKTGDVILYDMK